jgi:hypothetical protein
VHAVRGLAVDGQQQMLGGRPANIQRAIRWKAEGIRLLLVELVVVVVRVF